MSYETFTVKPRIPAKAVAIGIGAVALMATIFSGFYTVDEKERGVLLRNGALVEVSDPGLHFKWPFIESVKYISVQNHTVRYESLPAYSGRIEKTEIVR